MSTDTIDWQRKLQLAAGTGHLLVVWDILANRVSQSTLLDMLSEKERSALWLLQDLFESALVESGIRPCPQEAWNKLLKEATEQIPDLHTD
jgi:hypothetical protein